MPIVTRFAPSPTGFLHIGAARTALFNWLFARHHRGRFLLRIEDTDRVRSTDEAVSAILEGLRWLGLDWDGPPVFQFSRAARHAEAARQLLADGKAYLCYASPEELEQMRQQARAEGRPVRYDGRWRDRDPREAPSGVAPVVRLRAPRDGKTTIDDLVQGAVTVANDQLDDMVLLRADGTPTYMLAVVVDDHDMHVSHVIRGDDHLTNTFRQYQLYQAFGWSTPAFAHIPLIHGADGAKLSKRHGAVGLDVYRNEGYLPDALFNYLLRLGWSHGDDEFISRAQAVEWFDLGSVGRSPARFDLDKLLQINAHYLRQCDNRDLADQVLARLTAANGRRPAAHAQQRLGRAMDGLKVRAKTLTDLAERSAFCAFDGPVPIEPAAATLLTAEARRHLAALRPALERSPEWRAEDLERSVRDYVQQAGTPALKLKDVAQPLRASLTGAAVSPPIFEVMEILGRDETLVRLTASLGGDAGAYA